MHICLSPLVKVSGQKRVKSVERLGFKAEFKHKEFLNLELCNTVVLFSVLWRSQPQGHNLSSPKSHQLSPSAPPRVQSTLSKSWVAGLTPVALAVSYAWPPARCQWNVSIEWQAKQTVSPGSCWQLNPLKNRKTPLQAPGLTKFRPLAWAVHCIHM